MAEDEPTPELPESESPGSEGPTYEERLAMREALSRAKRQRFGSAGERSRMRSAARRLRLDKEPTVRDVEAVAGDSPGAPEVAGPPPRVLESYTPAPPEVGISSRTDTGYEPPPEVLANYRPVSKPIEPDEPPSKKEPPPPAPSYYQPERSSKATEPAEPSYTPPDRPEPEPAPDIPEDSDKPLYIGEPPEEAEERQRQFREIPRDIRYQQQQPSLPAPQAVEPDSGDWPRALEMPEPPPRSGARDEGVPVYEWETERIPMDVAPPATVPPGAAGGSIDVGQFEQSEATGPDASADGITSDQGEQIISLLGDILSAQEAAAEESKNIATAIEGLSAALSEIGGYGP